MDDQRILWVDGGAIDALREALQEDGFQVDVAPTVCEAFLLLREDGPRYGLLLWEILGLPLGGGPGRPEVPTSGIRDALFMAELAYEKFREVHPSAPTCLLTTQRHLCAARHLPHVGQHALSLRDYAQPSKLIAYLRRILPKHA